MKKDLLIAFNASLHELDSEIQTFGCRQKNPDICGNNSLSGICAFTSDDCICRKPSRAWRKQYTALLSQEDKK